MTDYVVVWEDDSNQNDIYQVKARGFTAAGKEAIRQFTVNTNPKGHQLAPVVAMDLQGNFVVAWEDARSGDSQIYMRGFDALGGERIPETRVNATGSNERMERPSIAMADDGRFVIVWTDLTDVLEASVKMRGFQPDGASLFPQQTVAEPLYERDNAYYGAVAMARNGDFAVVWERGARYSPGNPEWRGGPNNRQEHGYAKLYVRGYQADSMATPRFAETEVNPESPFGGEYDPSIAMGRSGDFVVAWHQQAHTICARYFTPDGSDYSGPITVRDMNATGHIGWRRLPKASIESHGGAFVVAWEEDTGNNGYYEVLARRFYPHGVPRGRLFTVNPHSKGDQIIPDVAVDPATGSLAVVWQDNPEATLPKTLDGKSETYYQLRIRGFGGTSFGQKTVNTDHHGHQLKPRIAARRAEHGLDACIMSDAATTSEQQTRVQMVREAREELRKETLVGAAALAYLEPEYARVSGYIRDLQMLSVRDRDAVRVLASSPLLRLAALALSYPSADPSELPEPWSAYLCEVRETIQEWLAELSTHVANVGGGNLATVAMSLSADDLAHELARLARVAPQMTHDDWARLVAAVNVSPGGHAFGRELSRKMTSASDGKEDSEKE